MRYLLDTTVLIDHAKGDHAGARSSSSGCSASRMISTSATSSSLRRCLEARVTERDVIRGADPRA